jgi:hypothetical protein
MAIENEIFEPKISQSSHNAHSNCSETVLLINEENENEIYSFKGKLIVKHLPTSTLSISNFFSLIMPSTQIQFVDDFIVIKSASIFIVNRVIRL